MKKIFIKLLRIALWSVVGLLLGFIIYITGAVMAMTAIEEKCEQYNGFTTTEDKVFMCIPVKEPIDPKKGVDS